MFRFSGSLQGAFEEVYELDVDDDVNLVLYALREPLRTCAGGSPGRAAGRSVRDPSGRPAGKPAGGALLNVQHMAACLTRLAQAGGHDSGDRALGGCLDAESALARLVVRKQLQRLHLLPRATL